MELSEHSELADVLKLTRTGNGANEGSEVEKMLRRPSTIMDFAMDDDINEEMRRQPSMRGMDIGMDEGAAEQATTIKKKKMQTVAFEKPGSGTSLFSFERMSISKPSAPKKKAGGLSQLLGGEGAAKSSQPTWEVKIYLPNTDLMKISVFEICTVEECIKTSLQQHKERGIAEPKMYHSHPECYELRFHDDDGEPDDDFPPIDKKRALKKLGNNMNEFCLCELKGKVPPEGEDGEAGGGEQGRDDLANFVDEGKLRIQMPSGEYTVVMLDAETNGEVLLPDLAKAHQLQLYTHEYVLQLLPKDNERHQFPNGLVNMKSSLLMELQVSEIQLVQKMYEDTPRHIPWRRAQGAEGGGNAARGGGNAAGLNTGGTGGGADAAEDQSPFGERRGTLRPAEGEFLFNDLTAQAYQEWKVVKTNKFGRKQERLMGVDGTSIYNMKPDGKRSNVRVQQRLITDIVSIGYRNVASQREFDIVYKEPSGQNHALAYCADTPKDCAEIVGKIKFLVDRTARKKSGATVMAGLNF
jgi:hypothetical protein